VADSRLTYKPLTVEARLRLETMLARRWGRKHGDEALRQLVPWSGWRICTEKEFVETVGYLSRQGRARRVREAADELPAMRMLPGYRAPDAVTRYRVAFGIEPASAIIQPEHRMLSPFHVVAIIRRGAPMAQLVCRHVGGMWLQSVDVLRQQLVASREALGEILDELDEPPEPPSWGQSAGGINVHAFTF